MASISVFGPLRDKVGNRINVQVPEKGMLFSDVIKVIDAHYNIAFTEYIEMPLVVVLVNGKKIKRDYNKLINIGDEILITTMISGG